MKGPDAQLTHVGFMVRDLDAMVAFYSRILGLVLTDRGPYSRTNGEIAFMSRNPAEHHQVVFASGRPADLPTTLNPISFLVGELEDLRTFHARLVEEKVAELAPKNHGNAWSIYFMDPEGNRIELYTPTPWHVAQPYGKDLDLTEDAGTIRAKTLAMIAGDPTHTSREAWAAKLKREIEGG